MSDSPQPLKHSIGRPFWIGCLVGPILFLIWAKGIIQDSITFWLFSTIAVVVFGPIGGLVFQVVHDVFIARRLRLIHLWDFLVFTAIVIALVVAAEGLFHATGKQAEINPFKNRTFDIAGAFILLTLSVYAISKNSGPLLSRQTWVAILLTIASLGACTVIDRLTGIDLGWLLVIGAAFWAAIDSRKIQLKRFESGISYGPLTVFVGFVFAWLIAFPWYLIVRHKIKTGTAILKDAPSPGVIKSG